MLNPCGVGGGNGKMARLIAQHIKGNCLLTFTVMPIALGAVREWRECRYMLLIRKRKCPKCGAMVVQFNLFRTPIVIKNCSNCGAKMDKEKI